MSKKKPIFVTFEGIEGSGKSYQCRKLYKSLRKKNLSVVLTREPGGTPGAEKIREVILEDYFHHNFKEKFNKYTDTLLYLAARNEHIENKIKPAIYKKKIIICDRFIDSTLAYQVYGKGVNKNLVDTIHKYILGNIKPDLTFILKANISKDYTLLIAISVMVFYVYAAQCMSTFAIVRRETNTWKWPIFMIVYMTALAYVGAMLVYQVGSAMGYA